MTSRSHADDKWGSEGEDFDTWCTRVVQRALEYTFLSDTPADSSLSDDSETPDDEIYSDPEDTLAGFLCTPPADSRPSTPSAPERPARPPFATARQLFALTPLRLDLSEEGSSDDELDLSSQILAGLSPDRMYIPENPLAPHPAEPPRKRERPLRLAAEEGRKRVRGWLGIKD